MRMNYRMRIEHWRGNELLASKKYLCTSQWSGPTGTHVFAILPYELIDGDRVMVFQNDVEVDGLTA